MRLIALLAVPLAGCAFSPDALSRTDVDLRLASPKSPQVVAQCVYGALNFDNPMENDGDHYWVTRMGTNGIPNSRWDFLPDGNGGSRVELRANVPLGNGGDKVRACL